MTANLERYAGLSIRPWLERVNAEFAGRRLGDVERCLALGDLTGGHQKVDILARRNAEFRHDISLRPTQDLPRGPIDDRAEEFAGPIIEQPNAIRWRPRRDADRSGAHDVIFEAIVAAGVGFAGPQVERRTGHSEDQAGEQPEESAGVSHRASPGQQ